MDKFCVKVSHQQKGLGEKTVAMALDMTKQLGYETLRLYVVDFNLPSLKFYEQLDFIKAKGVFIDQVDGRILKEIGFEKACQ